MDLEEETSTWNVVIKVQKQRIIWTDCQADTKLQQPLVFKFVTSCDHICNYSEVMSDRKI